MMRISTLQRLFLGCIVALATMGRAGAQGWIGLPLPAGFAPSTALLLTDGSVLCQSINSRGWLRLHPDENGDYLFGTWTAINPMFFPRLYYASVVLADGRVFVAGGEYQGGTAQVDQDTAEIWDPKTGVWTGVSTPGWGALGDAPCAVLPNGKVMVGSISSPYTAILDPATLGWGSFRFKFFNSNEETWTLLPDGNVLTAATSSHPASAYFHTAKTQWVLGPSTTSSGGRDLVEAASSEIGPAVLLPNNNVLAFGASGNNDFFNWLTYTWEPTIPFPEWQSAPLGLFPSITFQLGIKDGPACLLPNGSVLCATGPVDGVNNHYLGPTIFFEYYPTLGSKVIPQPPSSLNAPYVPAFGIQGWAPYNWRMLMLPSGQVFVTNSNFNNGNPEGEAFLYSPTPFAINNSWRPVITKCPANMTQGKTYTIYGKQFNGLSQCSSYGDDASSATNYPLVRVRNDATGHIKYLRTYNHSTMAVATGTAIVSTHVYVPLRTEGGNSTLEVVANG